VLPERALRRLPSSSPGGPDADSRSSVKSIKAVALQGAGPVLPQRREEITHFARGARDLQGLGRRPRGPAGRTRLGRTPAYRSVCRRRQLGTLDRLGEKSRKNLHVRHSCGEEHELPRFRYALGIRDVGEPRNCAGAALGDVSRRLRQASAAK